MNADIPRAITSDEIATYHRDGVVLLPGMFDQGWIELLAQGLETNCASPTDRSRVWDRDAKGRDDLTVTVEVRTADHESLQDAYAEILRRKIGVAVDVSFAAPGALSEQTQIESRQKPIRLLDERFDDPK